MLLSVISLVIHKRQNQTKCLKTLKLISSPFHKIHTPIPLLRENILVFVKYLYIMKNDTYNLLFSVRCWCHRTAVWFETPWERGQNTIPHENFDI